MKTTVLEDKLFKMLKDNLADLWQDDLISEAGKSLRNSNPCWKGYHPVGTKKKGGKTVPNCVPSESVAEAGPNAPYTPSPAKPFRNPRGFNKQGTGVGNKLAQLNRKEWEEKKKKEQSVAEGSLEEYGDTAKGQKMLGKVHNRAADQVTSKKADKDPAYARKAQQTQDRAWDRLAVKEQGVAEGKINPAGLNHTQQIGDYVYRAKALNGSDKGEIEMTAYDGKKSIADTVFMPYGSGGRMISGQTYVHPAYRGKGVAAGMYAYLRMLGFKIEPSGIRTDAGKAMWDKWEKAGDAKYLSKGVAEGQENFNGIDISMEIQKDDEYVDDEDYDNQVLYVTASSKGKELGHVLFAFDGEYLMPQDLEVEERYRGQGIAQIMYDYVKSKGYKIRRSGQQTDAGAGFWDKHKPGKNIWEQGVAENFELDESNELKGTLRTIANDIAEPITSLYETLKYMAKRYYDSHGDLKGFGMVAGGVGSRWFQTFYFNRLQNELFDLCKQNTKITVPLQQFLRGTEVKGKIENAKGFSAISKELPDILATIGAKLNYAPLANNARRWIHNREEYDQYLSDLELSDYEDDDEIERAPKAPKDPAMGQQRSQAEEIVNDVLKKLPSKIAGDIRNAIARSPNKIQALQQELQKRGVKVPMENMAGVGDMDDTSLNAVYEAKATKTRLDPSCWKGYHKAGTKVKGGTRVNNCVPNEAANPAQQAAIAIAKKKKKGTTEADDIEHGYPMMATEHKKGVKAVKYTKKPKGIEPMKPRNFVAKNAVMGGAGAHKNKKKETKHKHVEIGETWEREMTRAIRLLENK